MGERYVEFDWPTSGWKESTPEEQGMDSAGLEQAYAYLVENMPAFRELILVRHGRIVFRKQNQASRERRASVAFRGLAARWAARGRAQATFRDNEGERWNIRSATKSLLSALVGIAIREKCLDSLDRKVAEFLPEYFARVEPAKRDITLRHLLTMASGLSSIERGLTALNLLRSDDWTRFMVRSPLEARPGSQFRYNSANPHLMSAVLTRITGISTLDFANQYLFHPLGIRNAVWETAPEGVNFGGGNLFLTVQEMAKIGFLFLKNGEWDGGQVVPSEWVRESLGRYQTFIPGWDYGYYWYLHDETDEVQSKSYFTFSAAGAGGQKIVVIPDLDVVWTAIAKTDFVGDKGIFLNLITSRFLIPAVRGD